MALITIVLACALGAVAGGTHVAFGGTWWQGLMIYAGFSTILPTFVILSAVVSEAFIMRRPSADPAADLEQWHDWQMEEEARAERGNLQEAPAPVRKTA
ncbi:hypothetical protein E4Z66_15385 [Aliishimia ponticola]|uniref:Uncharacterized protein n=1 Tax=Aliishimia ponticola TaxID=2499833 RepID=A0A4S4N9C7_9RHOB|nr:hypothetical protein [Aliishimia ponticola]THH35205.1 hypothetical protein E4Z66_15385 [Aliishimia ponticola]